MLEDVDGKEEADKDQKTSATPWQALEKFQAARVRSGSPMAVLVSPLAEGLLRKLRVDAAISAEQGAACTP